MVNTPVVAAVAVEVVMVVAVGLEAVVAVVVVGNRPSS